MSRLSDVAYLLISSVTYHLQVSSWLRSGCLDDLSDICLRLNTLSVTYIVGRNINGIFSRLFIIRVEVRVDIHPGE